MTTIKTNEREILVVEVPEDSYEFFIGLKFNQINHIRYIDKKNEPSKTIDLPYTYKNYKIIGLLRDLSESECVGLVEKDPRDSKGFADYNFYKEAWLRSAKSSLISLLQSNGLNTSNNLLLIKKLNNNS